MMIRRSQKEEQSRHATREALAKRIYEESPNRSLSFRHAQEDGNDRVVPSKNHQIAQLSAGALAFTSRELSRLGIGGIRLSHAKVTTQLVDKGPRMLLVRKASIQVRASFPTANKDTYEKGDARFALSVGFEGGKYSLNGLLSQGRLVPVSKQAVLRIAEESDIDDTEYKLSTPSEKKCPDCGKSEDEGEGCNHVCHRRASKKKLTRRTAQVPDPSTVIAPQILDNPSDTAVSNAPDDLNALKEQSDQLTNIIAQIGPEIQRVISALEAKKLQKAGLEDSSLASVQAKVQELQSLIQSKLVELPGNFYKFKNGALLAKVQYARPNAPHFGAVIDQMVTRGKGIIKRVGEILQFLTPLFRSMSTKINVSEISEKDIPKVTKKNVQNVDKIVDFDKSVQEAQSWPRTTKYFKQLSDQEDTGKLKNVQARLAQIIAELDVSAIDSLLDESIDALNSATTEWESVSEAIDAQVEGLEEEEGVEETYPLPHAASKAFSYSAARSPHGGLGVRRTYASKRAALLAKGFTEEEIASAI
jgi:hypothetical protein